jgi:sugar lactone lactonase YvrE
MTPDGRSRVVTTGFERGKLVALATTASGDLYVSERGDQGRIMRIAPDGTREVLLQRRGSQFYGLAVDDHFLYAIDLRNREMLRIPRDAVAIAPPLSAVPLQ